jgi:hypothetical protein
MGAGPSIAHGDRRGNRRCAAGVEGSVNTRVAGIAARLRAPFLLVTAGLLVLAGCGGAGAPGASAGPGATPTTGPAQSRLPPTGTIDHATGPTDVVFRFDEGGGFVPVGFFATEAPAFTLYGDGTVLFSDGTPVPPSSEDGISRLPAYRTVRLTEDQVQAFLQFAIADGGLGVARDYYSSQGADLPTSTFTLNAGGTAKVVSVTGLGLAPGDGADAAIREALAGLRDRIWNFAGEVEGDAVWTPDRWRGILTPDAVAPLRAWPWPEIAPSQFVQHPEAGAPRFLVRTMTPGEIAVLGLDGIEGGFSGLALTGPDGMPYLFALRPLLPEEQY